MMLQFHARICQVRIPNNNSELYFLPTRSDPPDTALFRQLHYEYRQSCPMEVHVGICIVSSSGMALSFTTSIVVDGGTCGWLLGRAWSVRVNLTDSFFLFSSFLCLSKQALWASVPYRLRGMASSAQWQRFQAPHPWLINAIFSATPYRDQSCH